MNRTGVTREGRHYIMRIGWKEALEAVKDGTYRYVRNANRGGTLLMLPGDYATFYLTKRSAELLEKHLS